MLTCRSAAMNHPPHHARPAGGGVVRVVVHVVLPLVVEQKLLHGRSDTDDRGAASAEKLTSRTRLGPQPMPSVLAEKAASDGARADTEGVRTTSPCPCRWPRSWRSALPRCTRSRTRCCTTGETGGCAGGRGGLTLYAPRRRGAWWSWGGRCVRRHRKSGGHRGWSGCGCW